MIDLLQASATATLAWSAAVASVSFEAIRRYSFRPAMRTEPRPSRNGRGLLTVLVVRPCAGSEHRLDTNLRSIALARSSFVMHCRIAVADATDAASPAAHAAADALSAEGFDARVVLTAARGPNRKVSQIHAAIEAFEDPFDVLLVADSDVDLDGADLDLLVSPLVEASATDGPRLRSLAQPRRSPTALRPRSSAPRCTPSRCSR